jgi:hypothetical protein
MARKTTKKKGADGKACWKGYRYAGTKKGKDSCVKVTRKKKGKK